MEVNLLDTPIEYLKGVGPKRGELLRKELGISTYYDLLTHYPFRYVDKSRFYKIAEINNDSAYVQLRGKIVDTEMLGKGASQRFVVTLQDDSGTLELVYFQGIKWIKDKFTIGSEYVVFGKPSLFNGRYNISHPDTELFTEWSATPADPLHPLYSTSEKSKSQGVNSRLLSKLTKSLLPQVKSCILETLPSFILNELKLISRQEALTNIHFPANLELLQKATARLKFEELFFIQLKLLQFKVHRSRTVQGAVFSKIGDYFNSFYNEHLPFELTNAQKKVLREIRLDVGSGQQMNRLLQGDVGSGKTLVALMCMLMALDNGFQACLMAPTEILATQHFHSISKFLSGLDIKVDLLTGSTKANQRKQLHKQLENTDLHLLIGTHALLEDTVQFGNLGLVVIDEQHRFGVEQRAKLWSKSEMPPHILVMTATPIPRTLAMTLYGDLDYSVIDELPPGRKPIKTYHFYENDHSKVYNFLRQQIESGRQAYIVYPLIEESETLDLKNITDGFETICKVFPQYKVSLVHGRLKADEKEAEMQRFKSGETQIMVATTVIEVGVDVPNASVMVIENSERFGLSQLHQLRGRVGRGADQSHCILMSSYKLSKDGRTRIETMVRTNDGFEISDVDLRLRGPGDMEGTRQSGVIDLKIADIIRDEAILKYARRLAEKILAVDPKLEDPQNELLSRQLKFLGRKRTDWSMIS